MRRAMKVQSHNDNAEQKRAQCDALDDNIDQPNISSQETGCCKKKPKRQRKGDRHSDRFQWVLEGDGQQSVTDCNR